MNVHKMVPIRATKYSLTAMAFKETWGKEIKSLLWTTSTYSCHAEYSSAFRNMRNKMKQHDSTWNCLCHTNYSVLNYNSSSSSSHLLLLPNSSSPIFSNPKPYLCKNIWYTAHKTSSYSASTQMNCGLFIIQTRFLIWFVFCGLLSFHK